MKKYYIRFEMMGGEMYYMIYKRGLFGLFNIFIERWNTIESALIRLKELQ